MKDSIAYVPLRDGCSQLINSVEHDGDGVPGPQSSGSKTRTCSIGEGFVILCGLDYVLAPWPGRVQPLVGVEELQGELWPQAGVATASLVVVVPEALVLGRLLAHPVHAYHSPPQASFKNMPLGH